MHAHDMLVETPVPLVDLDYREAPGHPGTYQCSSCGIGPLGPWHSAADIRVVRHWTKSSFDFDDNGGGKWWWYCPEHFEARGGQWWPNSDLAPARFLPHVAHPCERPGGLRKPCGDDATVAINRVWTCDRHANAARNERRLAELLADDEDE